MQKIVFRTPILDVVSTTVAVGMAFRTDAKIVFGAPILGVVSTTLALGMAFKTDAEDCVPTAHSGRRFDDASARHGVQNRCRKLSTILVVTTTGGAGLAGWLGKMDSSFAYG